MKIDNKNGFEMQDLVLKISHHMNGLDMGGEGSVLLNKAFLGQLRRDLLEMVMEDFPEFLAARWPRDKAAEQKQNRSVQIFLARNILDRPEQVMRHDQLDFADAYTRHPDAMRSKSIYPLSRDEVKTALDFEDTHAAWRRAVATLQYHISDYMDAVTQAVQSNLIQGAIRKSLVLGNIQAFKGEASKTSFLREFSPVMSASLSASGADGLDEKAFARALCETFRREAFRSSYCGELTVCPFGPVIGRLSSIVLKEDTDGRIFVSGDQKPGALFRFLVERAGNPDAGACAPDQSGNEWTLD